MNHKELLILILLFLFIAGGLFGVAVWLVLVPVCTCLSFWEKRKGWGNGPTKVTIADYFVLAIVFSETLSILFSEYRNNSILSSYPIVLAAFFWFFFRNHTVKRDFLYYLDIGLSVVLFILSIITIAGFISFKQKFAILAPTSLVEFKQGFSPGGAPINDWVFILLCLLPFPFELAAKGTKWVVIVTAIMNAAFALVAIGLCLSRGAYIAVAVFYGVILAEAFLGGGKAAKKTVVIMVGALLLGCMGELPAHREVITTLSMSKTSTQVRSTMGRFRQISDAVTLWKEHPWTGVGGGNFNLAYDLAIDDEELSTVRTTSTYSLILVERGLVGAMAYTGFIISILFLGLSRHRKSKTRIFYIAGFAAVCVRGFFFSSLFYYRITLTLVVLLAFLSVQETESTPHV